MRRRSGEGMPATSVEGLEGKPDKQREFILGLEKRCWASAAAAGNTQLPEVIYTEVEVTKLLDLTRASLASQPPLLELEPPLFIVGDIHGHYRKLLTFFATLGRPPNSRYLFLGDYVDRGEQSVEVIVMLFIYKVMYPDSFFLLRGNHEVQRINFEYGFYKDCLRLFPEGGGQRVYRLFNNIFCELPMTALIGGRMLCMHGGLSPSLQSLAQLRSIPKPLFDIRTGLANDLVWADPEVGLRGWQPSTRRTSFFFGADVVRRFVTMLGIDIIVRAHQVCQDGHRFFAERRLLTVFSAPMYDPVIKNSGAILNVQSDLVCEVIVFAPPARRRPKETFDY